MSSSSRSLFCFLAAFKGLALPPVEAIVSRVWRGILEGFPVDEDKDENHRTCLLG